MENRKHVWQLFNHVHYIRNLPLLESKPYEITRKWKTYMVLPAWRKWIHLRHYLNQNRHTRNQNNNKITVITEWCSQNELQLQLQFAQCIISFQCWLWSIVFDIPYGSDSNSCAQNANQTRNTTLSDTFESAFDTNFVNLFFQDSVWLYQSGYTYKS